MSPWTALFEALHSALIDEITEIQSDPKPELGLPIRLGRYMLPAPGILRVAMIEIELAGAHGLVFLASAFDPSSKCRLELETLWKAMFGRAGGEFHHRSIQPRVLGQMTLKEGMLPATTLQPNRVVWVPITLKQGVLYFGLGV